MVKELVVIQNPFIDFNKVEKKIKTDFFKSFLAKSISFSYGGQFVYIKMIYDEF